jgi:hypothetical protein
MISYIIFGVNGVFFSIASDNANYNLVCDGDFDVVISNQ